MKKQAIVSALLCLAAVAHAQSQNRTTDPEARRIAQRHEEEVRRLMGEIANTPPLVAPPTPVDDRTPSSDNNPARGELRKCRLPFDELHGEPYNKWPPCDNDRNGKQPKPTSDTTSAETGKKTHGDLVNDPKGPPKLPGYPNRSCWAAPDWCLQSTSEWGSSKWDRESKRLYTHHKNVCPYRIVVKACIEREGRKPDCGVKSEGLQYGETWKWASSPATGRYKVMHRGVLQGNDDLICPLPAGWKEMSK